MSALPFIYQSDRVEQRASDVSATDWRYQTHVENYPNFRRPFTGPEIVVKQRNVRDKYRKSYERECIS